MPGKRLTTKEVDFVCTQYTSGVTQAVLAEDLKRTQACISRVLKRNGVKTRWPQITSPNIATISAMRAGGSKLREIAELYGVTVSAISLALKRFDK